MALLSLAMAVGCVVDPGNAGETLESTAGGSGSAGTAAATDSGSSDGLSASSTAGTQGGTTDASATAGSGTDFTTTAATSSGDTSLAMDPEVCDPIGDEVSCDATEGIDFRCEWMSAVPVVVDEDAGVCAIDGEESGWCVALLYFEDGCGPSEYTCGGGEVEANGAYRPPLAGGEPTMLLTEPYGSCVHGPFWTQCDSADSGIACECQCG